MKKKKINNTYNHPNHLFSVEHRDNGRDRETVKVSLARVVIHASSAWLQKGDRWLANTHLLRGVRGVS